LNLGRATEDDTANVDGNRERVAHAVGIHSSDIHFVRQVHGARVVDRDGPPEPGALEEADGIVLRGTGAAAVLAADCVPMIIRGSEGVAALHAGWRGLAAGAIEAAVGKVGRDPIAWVGPSIHACCYEVGPEVISAFEDAGLPVADASHVDPGRAAVVALHRAGAARIAAWHECTSCTKRFFSHRRDGVTGRQAGLVAATNPV
jgi:YfiH family protein